MEIWTSGTAGSFSSAGGCKKGVAAEVDEAFAGGNDMVLWVKSGTSDLELRFRLSLDEIAAMRS